MIEYWITKDTVDVGGPGLNEIGVAEEQVSHRDDNITTDLLFWSSMHQSDQQLVNNSSGRAHTDKFCSQNSFEITQNLHSVRTQLFLNSELT